MGDDFHALFRRSETSWQEFWFSFLLYNAETASTKRDEPAIMAERGYSDTSRLGGLENRLPFLNLYFNSVDLKFNHLITRSNADNYQSFTMIMRVVIPAKAGIQLKRLDSGSSPE